MWNKQTNKQTNKNKTKETNKKKTDKKLFSGMSNLKTQYHFKLDFEIVGQRTRGKWLIHGTNHRKETQLQSLELFCRILFRIEMYRV